MSGQTQPPQSGSLGRPIFIQCGCWWASCLPYEVAEPQPSTGDKNRAPIGPEILSGTGAGVWRKAPIAFPDSNSVLDKFQSAIPFQQGAKHTLQLLFGQSQPPQMQVERPAKSLVYCFFLL